MTNIHRGDMVVIKSLPGIHATSEELTVPRRVKSVEAIYSYDDRFLPRSKQRVVGHYALLEGCGVLTSTFYLEKVS